MITLAVFTSVAVSTKAYETAIKVKTRASVFTRTTLTLIHIFYKYNCDVES